MTRDEARKLVNVVGGVKPRYPQFWKGFTLDRYDERVTLLAVRRTRGTVTVGKERRTCCLEGLVPANEPRPWKASS